MEPVLSYQYIYFLNKLKEDYNIDYIPVSSFNPDALYRVANFNDAKDKRGHQFYSTSIKVYLAHCYAELGDKNTLLSFYNSLPDKIKIDIQGFIFQFLLKFKNITLFEEFRKLWNKSLINTINYDIQYVVQNGDIEFANKLIKDMKKEPNYDEEEGELNFFYTGISGAAEIGDENMILFLQEKYKTFNVLPFYHSLRSAIYGCQTEFIRKLLTDNKNKDSKQLAEDLATALSEYLVRDYIDFLSQEQAYRIVEYVIQLLKWLGNSNRKILSLISGASKPSRFLKSEVYDPLLAEYVKELLT